MRDILFRRLIGRMEPGAPGWIRRIQLRILMRTTAEIFRVSPRPIWNMEADQALQAYAAFTVDCMERHPADAERAYRISYTLGRRLRRITGFQRRDDLQKLVFFLYRNIGIAMSGELPGSVSVSQCYFSKVYTPAQCSIISAMDAGVIAGILGGGTLNFTGRITEGRARCTACFKENAADE